MRTYVPRASRVELQIPVRYRVANGQDWLQTNVVNMSESGILFGPTSLHEGAEIEMIVSIPKSIEDLPAGEHFFVGEVVRTTEAGTAAAAFHEKRFLLES